MNTHNHGGARKGAGRVAGIWEIDLDQG